MRGTRKPERRQHERGQVLVIFAFSVVMFIGMCAVVVDVAWYWSSMLRMQRAADAAALAGVVYLPGNLPSAVTAARAEALKNGYANGSDGVTVNAGLDPNNSRSLRVSLSAAVPTFFMRLFGISSIAGSSSSKAEYVLPVPMGSPDNYYGVFGKVRTPGGGRNVTTTTTGTTDSAAADDGAVGQLDHTHECDQRLGRQRRGDQERRRQPVPGMERVRHLDTRQRHALGHRHRAPGPRIGIGRQLHARDGTVLERCDRHEVPTGRPRRTSRCRAAGPGPRTRPADSRAPGAAPGPSRSCPTPTSVYVCSTPGRVARSARR